MRRGAVEGAGLTWFLLDHVLIIIFRTDNIRFPLFQTETENLANSRHVNQVLHLGNFDLAVWFFLLI